jgi:hypothetical protein
MTGSDIVVGVAEASALMKFTSPSQTATWQGITVDGSSVLIRRTYNGDANLDGAVDADDYFVIDSNYGESGAAVKWHLGDFDRDGRVDADDYFVIDSSFSANHAPLGSAAIQSSAALAGAELPGTLTIAPPDRNNDLLALL